MDIVSQDSDSLSLDFVKEHLNVDFTEDDVLIQSYMDASLIYLEKALHRSILNTDYASTADEIIPIVNGYSYYSLRLADTPTSVTVIGDVTTELFSDEYIYDIGNQKLNIQDIYEGVTSITAVTGGVENSAETQIRLMLIANWYAFRESDIIGNIKEIPTGVERMMALYQNSPF